MPLPDEDRLGAERHAERRVGGRGDAAGGEVRHRQLARRARPRARARAARRASWPRAASSSGPSGLQAPDLRSGCARRWRTASTMSPVPASPLVRISDAPSAMRRSASPRSRQPQTNGTLKACLSMWNSSSAGVEHLALVDEVDLERLEDARLDEVADAALGHHRDDHRAPGSRGSSSDRWRARRRPPCGSAPARARAPSPPTAPASSAMRACSALTTSMMTPPFSISARPTLVVPVAPCASSVSFDRSTAQTAPRSAGVARLRSRASARDQRLAEAPRALDEARRRLGAEREADAARRAAPRRR